MRHKKSIFILSILLTFTIMSTHYYPEVETVSAQTPHDFRILRLILGHDNLTFSFNDTIFIFMSGENIGFDTFYDIYLNFSAKENMYEIVSSSNTTTTNATDFVEFSVDQLNPGDLFTFNMTLRIISNETSASMTIDAIRIDFKVNVDKLPDHVLSPAITVSIVNPEQDESALREKIFGFLELDTLLLVVIFLFPVLVGFGLSFLFGRRQKNQ